MKTLFSGLGILTVLMGAVAILMLGPAARAQQGTRLSGTVLDFDAKPFPNVTVTITDKDNGTKYTLTTDKDGKFAQPALKNGNYEVNFKAPNIDYTEGFRIDGTLAGTGAVMTVNFKDIAAKTGYDVNAAKKKAEAANKFKEMKTHFDNGVHAMNDADNVRTQLRAAQPDQKAALQATLNTDYQTAINEFQQAQQGASPTDPNQAVILSDLGAAYDGAGKYDQAVDSLQKATALKPTAAMYQQLGTDLARQGKMADAGQACDKAATLDPTNKDAGELCYRNIGIILTNAGKMNDAVAPLQKATQLNPNDADAWYLLGNALVAGIDTKQEGTKQVYVVPPGTEEAYKKYLELQPNGPHAAEAQQSLQAVEQMDGEKVTTTIKNKKPGTL
jgi:tetratricopeptide (TPR) repeat protein